MNKAQKILNIFSEKNKDDFTELKSQLTELNSFVNKEDIKKIISFKTYFKTFKVNPELVKDMKEFTFKKFKMSIENIPELIDDLKNSKQGDEQDITLITLSNNIFDLQKIIKEHEFYNNEKSIKEKKQIGSVDDLNNFDRFLKMLDNINFNVGAKFKNKQDKLNELKKMYPIAKKFIYILDSDDVALSDFEKQYRANFLELLDILEDLNKKYDQDTLSNITNYLLKYNSKLRTDLFNQGKLFSEELEGNKNFKYSNELQMAFKQWQYNAINGYSKNYEYTSPQYDFKGLNYDEAVDKIKKENPKLFARLEKMSKSY